MRPFMSLALPAVLILLSAPAWADSIIVPGAFSSIPGNSDNAYPFNAGFANLTSMRYQQVYDASQFLSLSGPLEITAMAFRPSVRSSDGASMTLPNVQINLSTTSVVPDGFGLTFSQNVGADDTIVYSGSLTLSTAYRGEPMSGPNIFDVIVYLTTPFVYDPQKGDLLLDVRNFDAVYNSQMQMDFAYILGDSVSRIWQIDVNSPTGQSDTGGLITEYFMNGEIPELPPPVPFIPEPSTLALLSLGLVGLIGYGSKHRVLSAELHDSI